MSLLDRFPDTVIILSPTMTADVYGNPSTSWEAATETTVPGWLQEGTSLEAASSDRVSVSTSWRLYLPPGTNLTARDRVRVDGLTFEIDGDPYASARPFGGGPGGPVRANLKRLEG